MTTSSGPEQLPVAEAEAVTLVARMSALPLSRLQETETSVAGRALALFRSLRSTGRLSMKPHGPEVRGVSRDWQDAANDADAGAGRSLHGLTDGTQAELFRISAELGGNGHEALRALAKGRGHARNSVDAYTARLLLRSTTYCTPRPWVTRLSLPCPETLGLTKVVSFTTRSTGDWVVDWSAHVNNEGRLAWIDWGAEPPLRRTVKLTSQVQGLLAEATSVLAQPQGTSGCPHVESVPPKELKNALAARGLFHATQDVAIGIGRPGIGSAEPATLDTYGSACPEPPSTRGLYEASLAFQSLSAFVNPNTHLDFVLATLGPGSYSWSDIWDWALDANPDRIANGDAPSSWLEQRAEVTNLISKNVKASLSLDHVALRLSKQDAANLWPVDIVVRSMTHSTAPGCISGVVPAEHLTSRTSLLLERLDAVRPETHSYEDFLLRFERSNSLTCVELLLPPRRGVGPPTHLRPLRTRHWTGDANCTAYGIDRASGIYLDPRELTVTVAESQVTITHRSRELLVMCHSLRAYSGPTARIASLLLSSGSGHIPMTAPVRTLLNTVPFDETPELTAHDFTLLPRQRRLHDDDHRFLRRERSHSLVLRWAASRDLPDYFFLRSLSESVRPRACSLRSSTASYVLRRHANLTKLGDLFLEDMSPNLSLASPENTCVEYIMRLGRGFPPC